MRRRLYFYSFTTIFAYLPPMLKYTRNSGHKNLSVPTYIVIYITKGMESGTIWKA